MMDKKYIWLAVIAIAVILVYWLLPKAQNIDDYRGQAVKIENGNVLVMKSGLRVRLLGVKPNDESVALFLENNVLHKRITLIHDSKNESVYKKNNALVRAYVKMGKRCVNRMVLQDCGKNAYSEAYLNDSLQNFRDIFKDNDSICEIEDLALYMKQRTFTIFNGRNESKGTGFFINDNGLAVTNTHVLNYGEEESSVIVLYKKSTEDSELYLDNKRNVGNIKFVSPLEDGGMDFTIFTVQLEPGETVQSFRLAQKHARVGDECATYGNPRHQTGVFGKGHVSVYQNVNPINNSEMSMVYYNMSTNPGNSGGPVCNKYGEIIAVHEGGVKVDESGSPVQGENFGIDILLVRQVLDKMNLKYNGK